MYEGVMYCGAGKFVSRGEWMHPERVITSHKIIFVLNGTVYITEDGTQYQLQTNDLLLLEPNKRHFGYKASNNTSFYWLHFTGESMSDFFLKHQTLHDPYRLLLLFKQLLHYRSEEQAGECLDYFTRLILFECFSLQKQQLISKSLAEVAAWIRSNRDTLLTVEQISKHFGYNADYLSRRFRAHYGTSLKEYINTVKMQYIKQMLLTSERPLTEIAGHAGFHDYKYFLKFFKYHEGITPTQFLKAYPRTHVNNR